MTDPHIEPIVGHQDVMARLRAAWTNERIAGAYLLAGDEGIGKQTVARWWIRLIQCGAPFGEAAEKTACGACLSCRYHAEGHHPDLVVLEPEESTVITVDQVRDMRAGLSFPPVTAPRRAILIPDASRMNPAAANALLKVLEEPPARTVFLLLATHRERLLPTIVSRCQTVRCAAPGQATVLDHLVRARGLSAERARHAFIQAQGHIGAALAVLESPEMDVPGFESLGAPDTISEPTEVMEMAERVGKDPQVLRLLLAWLIWWLRDVLAWQTTADSARLLHPDRQTDIAWWAERLSVEDLLECARGVHNVWTSLHRNLNPQLAAEVVLLQLSIRLTARPVRRIGGL